MIQKQKQYTPVVRVKYNSLGSPYYHMPGNPDDKGQYSITVLGDPNEEKFATWLQTIESVREELLNELEKEEGKKLKRSDNSPISAEVDEEGNETGLTQVKFAHHAKGISKKSGSQWDIPVVVFDSLGVPVPQNLIMKIGRGSTVKVCFDAVAYLVQGKAGVRFGLRSTQLLKPQWYTPNNRDKDFEGQAAEEGFVVEEGVEL